MVISLQDTAGKSEQGVIEVDGMLWKPADDATTNAEDFRAARSIFSEIAGAIRWNPWVREDRTVEFDHAVTVMSQWKRAEPGFRQPSAEKIKREIDADVAKARAESDATREERELQRRARVPQYDEGREQARLALLEQESILAYVTLEHAELQDGSRFPRMEPGRRAEQVEDLTRRIAAVEERIAALRVQVGDPEAVVERHGWLPAERRELSLESFTARRQCEVWDLREHINRVQAALKATTDAGERRSLRSKIAIESSTRDTWMAVPELEPADMCADCAVPVAWHGWSTPLDLAMLGAGPCAAWPGWAERVRSAREFLMKAAEPRPAAPPRPSPKPLVVVPSGMPIGDIIKHLQEAQAKHPDAVVRRGDRNRWEIWPS